MSNFEQQAYEAVANGTATEAQKRAVEMDKLAKKAGFKSYSGSVDGNTFFSWGTELAESGKDAFRSKAQLHAEKPLVADMVPGFEQLIESEKRVDVSRPMTELLLDRDGRLLSRDKLAQDPAARGAPMNRWALSQILNRAHAPAGALAVLRPEGADVQGLPPGVASSVFASYMDGARTAKGKVKDVKLRTRLNKLGIREVFAAQSPRSPVFDANQAIKAFSKDAHDTARGSIQYDGRRWKFTAGVLAKIEPTVGEIFEGAVWISGTDDGSSSIKIGAEVVRVRCINLTTLHALDIETIRHQGRQLSFEEKIGLALQKAHAKIAQFADVWAAAEKEEVVEDADKIGARAILEAMVNKKLVHVPGVDGDALVDRLHNAWKIEPGNSTADFLNAVTRAAHSNTWATPWVTQSLADQAGALLYSGINLSARDFKQLS